MGTGAKPQPKKARKIKKESRMWMDPNLPYPKFPNRSRRLWAAAGGSGAAGGCQCRQACGRRPEAGGARRAAASAEERVGGGQPLKGARDEQRPTPTSAWAAANR